VLGYVLRYLLGGVVSVGGFGLGCVLALGYRIFTRSSLWRITKDS